MVLYTQVPTVAPPTDSRVVYDLPPHEALYIRELQCTFSAGALILNSNKRKNSINQ